MNHASCKHPDCGNRARHDDFCSLTCREAWFEQQGAGNLLKIQSSRFDGEEVWVPVQYDRDVAAERSTP